MKILLVNPPQRFYKKFIMLVEQLPLGLLYMAAILKKEGIAVEVLDALREGDSLCQQGDIWRYGLSWDDIAERIETFQPDAIGISNPYSSQISNAVMTANTAKRVNPDIITIMGGPHPTIEAFDLMNREPNLDICVRGEGEYTLKDLVKGHLIEKKKIEDIPGLVYRDGKKVLSTGEPKTIENLDNLPFPAYEMLDMEGYLSRHYKLTPEPEHPSRVIEMVTSRGCPYNCIFCSVKCVMGRRFRANSAEYVLSHIEYVIDKYGIEHIRFNDDNIALDRNRFDTILSGIIERRLKFVWDCPNGVRADTLEEPMLRKMKAAGCRHIYIAAESGNQNIVNKIIGKNTDLAHVERVLKLCAKIGIRADVYFILGFPGETLQTMHQTKRLGLKFLIKYNALPIFFIATPLPGTRLLEISRKNGYLEENFDPAKLMATISGNAVIHTDEFTTDEVNTIYRRANLECSIIRRARLLLTNPTFFFKKAFLHMKRGKRR